MSIDTLRIAAQSSVLSRIQALSVGKALNKAHRNLKIDYRFFDSLSYPLQDKTADLVVHSWKDLPTEPSSQTEIIATLARSDRRDLLLIKPQSLSGAINNPISILTSSPRREFNLASLLPKLLPRWQKPIVFEHVSGTFEDRITSLLESNADGLVVAKAAVDRILSEQNQEFESLRNRLRSALTNLRFMVLPLSENPCSPAQGAIAIESLKGSNELIELLKPVSCLKSMREAQEERSILAKFGGSCNQKIGVSVEEHNFGRVITVQGEQLDGQEIKVRELQRPTLPFPKTTAELTFPLAGERAAIMTRKSVPHTLPPKRPLFIARVTALPEDADTADRIVWSAGVTTWMKLAQRGIWVNGCSDGLGEEINPGVDLIVGEKVDWLKLTHVASAEKAPKGSALGTYELVPGTVPDCSNRTHFFWSSGSIFDACISKYPNIADGFHGCGPGATLGHIRERIGNHDKIRVFLDEEHWRSEVML